MAKKSFHIEMLMLQFNLQTKDSNYGVIDGFYTSNIYNKNQLQE